jgi:hypothetical protein
MKQTIVRSAIIAFGLLCVAVVGLIIFVGDTNHYEELDSLSARIDSDPTPEHLRDLLNYPADGAYSYYQMALTGASFSKHPEIFQAVSKNLQSDQERGGVQRLARLGAGVFEYHPEIKPEEFDKQFSAHSWLKQQHGEQGGAGQPATRAESR